jgi:hypothetical protein
MYDDLGGSAQSDIGWADIGKSISGIGASMGAFAGIAAGGGFEVNETGGQALLNALNSMRQWVTEQQGALVDIAQRLPLGSSDTAKVIAPYAQQVATDNQGFLTQLQEFATSLDNAIKGIQTAMANYKATEESKRAAFGGMEAV